MTLTTRERQIASLLVLGWTNTQIAMSLGISRRTVEDHRASVMKKRGVDNVVKLVRLEYGLDSV